MLLLATCQEIANGLLKKGMKQGVIYAIEQDRDTNSKYFQTMTSTSDCSDVVNGNDYLQISKIIFNGLA